MIHLRSGDTDVPLTVADAELNGVHISIFDRDGKEVAVGKIDPSDPTRFFVDGLPPGKYGLKFTFPDDKTFYPDQITVHAEP